MKNYIKYLALFMILILIGVIGINLYSNDTLKTKENLVDDNTLVVEENTSKEKNDTTKENSSTKEEKDTNEMEIKDNTDPNTNPSSIESVTSNKKEPSKESVKETTTNNNQQATTNNADINTIDLTIEPDAYSTNKNSESISNHNNTSTNEVIIIDVTNNNYTTRSLTEETNTKNDNTITNQEQSTTKSKEEPDSIVLELDNSMYKTTITESKKTTTVTSTNSSTTNKNTSEIDATTLGWKTNVSFSNIDNCIQNKVIKTVRGTNGKNSKIHICISKYNLNNTNSMMQNFAITDDFVYFSNPARGAWIKQESTYQKMGHRAALQKVSANYIVRVNKKTNTYQRVYVEYAGHSQSFDVANKSDKIYMNYFAKLYKTSLGYGGYYTGLTSIQFKNNTNKDGIEIIPTSATSISSNGQKLSILKSSSYYEDGKLNNSKYYDKVVAIGSSSNKMTNPEVAIDEDHNRMAIVSGTTAYIYNLQDFEKGKATILNKFKIAGGKQGIELYNGNLYLWTGNKTHDLRKYNISTGKLVNQISFDLYNYYGSNKGGEAEGISIHNGNIYIGIPGSKCNGKTCNDIFMVEGF